MSPPIFMHFPIAFSSGHQSLARLSLITTTREARGVIGVGQAASAHDPGSDSLEISGRHFIEVRPAVAHARKRVATRHSDANRPRRVERQRRRQCRGPNARRRLRRFQKTLIQGRQFGVGIVHARRLNARDERARWLDPERQRVDSPRDFSRTSPVPTSRRTDSIVCTSNRTARARVRCEPPSRAPSFSSALTLDRPA